MNSVPTIEEWLQQSDENRRMFHRDGFILDVTEQICERMQKQGTSRTELAANLGKSKSQVSQLLNGSRNMTLATLADIAYALNLNLKLQLTSMQPVEEKWENVDQSRHDNNNVIPLILHRHNEQPVSYDDSLLINRQIARVAAA
ncbi:MAG: helix-turn-helix transcriptional regulator [Magnetococcales bacterium]|nr:helix-turn-helix transcriptional regulator [Magnetococcales bacterium]